MLCILAKECSIFKYRETIAMSQVAAKLSKWYLSFFSAGLNIALLYLLQKTQSVSLWPKFSNFVQKSWDILSFSVSIILVHKYLYELHLDGWALSSEQWKRLVDKWVHVERLSNRLKPMWKIYFQEDNKQH